MKFKNIFSLFLLVNLILVCQIESYGQIKEIKKTISKEGDDASSYYTKFKKIQPTEGIDKWMAENGFDIIDSKKGKISKFGSVVGEGYYFVKYIRINPKKILNQNYIESFIAVYEGMKKKDKKTLDDLIQDLFCNHKKSQYGGDFLHEKAEYEINKIKKKYKIDNNFILDHLRLQSAYQNRGDWSKEAKQLEKYILPKYDLIAHYTDYPETKHYLNPIISLTQAYLLTKTMQTFNNKGSWNTIEAGFDYKKLKEYYSNVSTRMFLAQCSNDKENWTKAVYEKYDNKLIQFMKAYVKAAKQALQNSKISSRLDVAQLSEAEIKYEIERRLNIPEVASYLGLLNYIRDGTPFEPSKIKSDFYSTTFKPTDVAFDKNQPDIETYLNIKGATLPYGFWFKMSDILMIISRPYNCTLKHQYEPRDRKKQTGFNTLTTYTHISYIYNCECPTAPIFFASQLLEEKTPWRFDKNSINNIRQDSIHLEMYEITKQERIWDLSSNNKKSNGDYTILKEEGSHSIRKDEEKSYYGIHIYDGGIFSSNLDEDSYSVTYKGEFTTKSTNDPFNDSIYDVADVLADASEVEVIVRYRKYKGGPQKILHVKFETPGSYTININ